MICSRCVMNDVVDSKIKFNEKNICNHCFEYDEMISSRLSDVSALEEIVNKIKSSGRSKTYDCIIGVSGGVDSTYLAYLAKEKYNLKPLAVHFDNGWNSELAVKNIEKTLKNLDIDLFTYVVDWNEFKDMQLSFLKASVPDGEVPTDHAINSILWREASKRGIKYILSGMNAKTESTKVDDWSYGHSDWRYIRNIQKKFGKRKIKTYPYYSFFSLFYFTFIRGIRQVALLNYEDYDNKVAMNILENKLGWQYYGGKHYESVYTRWYQGFFLPKKFKVDKRYIHFSNLVKSNNMNRQDALNKLNEPAYEEELQKQDTEYVIKKLDISNEEYINILNKKIYSFRDYKNSFWVVSKLKSIVNYLRNNNLYPK
jgi:N-acetyl sugar amidotransferase